MSAWFLTFYMVSTHAPVAELRYPYVTRPECLSAAQSGGIPGVIYGICRLKWVPMEHMN